MEEGFAPAEAQEAPEQDAPVAADGQAKKPAQKKKGVIREYAEAIVVALVLALILRAYVVEAFKIPSGSMIPTLLVGDHLLVNKMVYGVDVPFMDEKALVYRNPAIYDIIVFRYPKDPKKNFIKRVIGTAGDVVEIRDKEVFVNGEGIKNSFVQHSEEGVLPSRMSNRDNYGPKSVPEGKVFVLGDNRDDSHDSRFWGYVDVDDIKGKAMFIYWSWDGDENTVRIKRIGRGIK